MEHRMETEKRNLKKGNIHGNMNKEHKQGT